MFYLAVIFTAILVIAVLHVTLFSTFLEALGCTVFATVAVVLWDGATAFFIRRLPKRWFLPENARFRVGERERRFYRSLKIKAWKDKVPELGCFTGFHKNHLEDAHDREYLGRFLMESNYGVVIHLVNALAGFLIVFIPEVGVSIGLPVASVNAVLSLMPMAILRYHTAPLLRLYERCAGKT